MTKSYRSSIRNFSSNFSASKNRNRMKLHIISVYFYRISILAWWAVLHQGRIRVTPHGFSVTTEGYQTTHRKPAMLGRVKLSKVLLTCDQSYFNQITALSRIQTLVTMMTDTCTATMPKDTYPPTRRNYLSLTDTSMWKGVTTSHLLVYQRP